MSKTRNRRAIRVLKRTREVRIPKGDETYWQKMGVCMEHGLERPCAEPNWSHACENCGERPTMCETGMCGPCTTGEAETHGGNW